MYLRRRRRPHPPRRQDRRDHRLRLPGPRPRAEPQGLGRRRRRRPARGLGVGRSRRKDAGLEVLPVADAASRGDIVMILVPDELHREVWEARRPRRHRRGQPAPLRPRLLDPLRRGRAARRASTSRSSRPRAPATSCAASTSRARGVPGLVAVHQDATGNAKDARARLRQGHRLHARRRLRDDLQGRDRDRPLRRAGRALRRRLASSSRPASRRSSRPATTRRWPTSSACTSSS